MDNEILDKLDYILNKTEDDSLVNDYAIEIENYIKDLEDLTDKYEEEHKTTFETWLKEINILTELEEWLKSNAKKIEMYADNYRKRNGRLENIEKTPIVGLVYSGQIGIQDTLNKIQELKNKYKYGGNKYV